MSMRGCEHGGAVSSSRARGKRRIGLGLWLFLTVHPATYTAEFNMFIVHGSQPRRARRPIADLQAQLETYSPIQIT